MNETPAPPGSRFATALSTAYLAFAVAFAVYCSFVALRGHYTVPFMDDWRILDDFFSAPDAKWWIFKDQVGHRMPVTLFLLYLDYTCLSGQTHLLVLAAILCAWIAAAAFYAALRAGRDVSPAGLRAIVGFFIFCLFWSGASFDFPWGINQGSQLGRMWFAISLAFALAYWSRGRQGEPVASLAAASCAAAVLATFSQGMGACAWPALVAVSIVARFPRRVVLGFLFAAALTVALYSVGLQEGVPYESYGAYTRLLTRHPLVLLRFGTAFIGAPAALVAAGWGLVTEKDLLGVATWVGGAALGGFLTYATVLLMRGSALRARDLVALGLMVFSLGGGILVGLNRAAFASNAVSVRFHSWTILFWMGAAAAAGSGVSGRRSRAAAVLLAWVISVSMLPALQAKWRDHGRNRERSDVEAAMHLSGVRREARAASTQALVREYRVTARLRADRRGFFADERAALLGSRLEERYPEGADSPCGSISRVSPIRSREPAAMVSGSVQPQLVGGAPSFVVLTDAAGRIRGFGALTPLSGMEPSHRRSALERTDVQWVGFINGYDRSQTYFAEAIVDERRTRCPLGSWPRRG